MVRTFRKWRMCTCLIFDPSFNAYRVVGEIVGKAFSDGLKLK